MTLARVVAERPAGEAGEPVEILPSRPIRSCRSRSAPGRPLARAAGEAPEAAIIPAV